MRRGLTIGKTRGLLYWVARLLGDVQAISKGPDAMAKRLARRATGKTTGRWLGTEIDDIDRTSAFINPIPEPMARGQIILPNVGQPPFQSLELPGNAPGGMRAQMVVNELLGLLGNMTGEAGERVTRLPLEDHVIGRAVHGPVPRGRRRGGRCVVSRPA